jgi:hypothetical protein
VPSPRTTDFPAGALVVTALVSELLEDDACRTLLEDVFPSLRNAMFRSFYAGMTPLMISAATPHVGRIGLADLEQRLVAARAASRDAEPVPTVPGL